MKTKIFLTSMLVMAMACPAFAATGTATAENGYGELADDTVAEDCGGAALTFNGEPKTSGTITYTANWDPDKCTIGFNYNGGSNTNALSVYSEYGTGAYNDATYQNRMTTSANPVDLTGVRGQQIAADLDANLPSGEDANNVEDLAFENNNDLSSITGYRPLKGFYASTSSNGNPYIGDDGYITADGTNAASSIAKEDGNCPTTTWYAQWNCFKAKPKTPTLPGYTFDYWSDAPDPTSANEIPLDENGYVCLNSNTTLHAQWIHDEYDVTYLAGGAHGMNAANGNNETTYVDSPYYMGDTVTVEDLGTIGFTLDGHSFTGWLCDNNIGTKDPNNVNNNKFTMPESDVECTAQWEWTMHTVTYLAGDSNNDGTGTSATGTTAGLTDKHMGETITVASNGFSLPGYSFAGWSCDSGIGSKNPNTTFEMPDTNVTCTAQWSTSSYPLTYNCNNGGDGTDPVDANSPYAYNTNVTILSNQSTCNEPAGKHFKSWKCMSGATELTITNNTITMPAGAVECSAQWTNVINLEWYDPIDGDYIDGEPETCDYGEPGDISPIAAPSKTGYTFTGWTVTDWRE